MQNIKLRKTTSELNAIRGPKGLIAYNTDDGSLRVYDGEVLGGWRFEGDPVELPPPGASELIAGDSAAGFYGEVSSSLFITGEDLAMWIGLSAGDVVNSDPGWLKFNLDGKTLFVAKQALRNNISWDDINEVSAVYGETTILINGNNFKVRLLKGTYSDPPSSGNYGYDIEPTHGSEWNRLLYHVTGVPFESPNTTLVSEGITEGDWAQYSESELGVSNTGQGYYSWCQETYSNYRVVRGNSVSRIFTGRNSDYVHTSYGWRPVLELVE